MTFYLALEEMLLDFLRDELPPEMTIGEFVALAEAGKELAECRHCGGPISRLARNAPELESFRARLLGSITYQWLHEHRRVDCPDARNVAEPPLTADEARAAEDVARYEDELAQAKRDLAILFQEHLDAPDFDVRHAELRERIVYLRAQGPAAQR